MQAVPGIYRHYKGPLYEVVGTANHSETRETLVIYRALYGEYGLWARPESMFLENVTYQEASQPRFALIKAF